MWIRILIIQNIYNKKMGIMEKIIKVAELISSDVRSRSNADKIRNEMIISSQDVILDFIGVIFISRSFTDELFNIIEEFKIEVKLINMSNIVKSMTDAVKSGRNKKRVRKEDNSEIKEFDDIESLSAFLLSM